VQSTKKRPAKAKAERKDKKEKSRTLTEPESDKVHVFISYRRADQVIATAIYEEIIEINRSRLECFLDIKAIEAGEDFRKEIDIALEAADWLICIYTGEQSEYCGFEVGVFSRGRSRKNGSGQSRLVCLHDVADIPGIFEGHQNQQVRFPPDRTSPGMVFDEEAFYSQSDLAKFFRDLCQYNNLYIARDPLENQRLLQAITSKAKRITEAFRASRGKVVRDDTPTQLGIEVSFTPAPDKLVAVIPDTAEVKGTYQSLGLFGQMPSMRGEQLPTTNWGKIKDSCRSAYNLQVPWIERLEKDMVNAATENTLAGPEAIFLDYQTHKTAYRAILVRHQLQWDGTHRFFVVFVPTLPRQFLGDQKTSLILAGLVVASRFRFAYLEQPARVAQLFKDTLSDGEFDGNYRQFQRDLERMRIEGTELGLVDTTAFVHAFGQSRQGVAESFLNEWKVAKSALDEALPPPEVAVTEVNRPQIREAIAAFIARMAVENARFMRVAVESFREELDIQLRRESASV
jgi:TIR domain